MSLHVHQAPVGSYSRGCCRAKTAAQLQQRCAEASRADGGSIAVRAAVQTTWRAGHALLVWLVGRKVQQVHLAAAGRCDARQQRVRERACVACAGAPWLGGAAGGLARSVCRQLQTDSPVCLNIVAGRSGRVSGRWSRMSRSASGRVCARGRRVPESRRSVATTAPRRLCAVWSVNSCLGWESVDARCR